MAESSMARILADHARRYPLLGVQDLYKLVHQAAMGSEHAVRSAAHARRWLEDEVAVLARVDPGVSGDSAGPAPQPAIMDPLVDPLSPDGSLARIHLRPYLSASLDLEALLAAFVRTANAVQGSLPELERYRSVARHLAEGGLFGFDAREMDGFFAEMAASGYPAAHHSAAYEAAYRPAYRVVQLALLDGLPDPPLPDPRP